MFPPPRSARPTNRHFRASARTTAAPATVWKLWTDVPNWKRWDEGLEDAHLTGPFTAGATGNIIAGGRSTGFTVSHLEPGKAYTITSKLPLGKLHVHRVLDVNSTGTQLTHEVWFTGPAALVFAALFGRKFRAMLPSVVEKVKTLTQ